MAKILFEVDVPNDNMAENWYLKVIGANPIKETLHGGPNFTGRVASDVRIPEFLNATVTLKLEQAQAPEEPGLLQGVFDDLVQHIELRETLRKLMDAPSARKAKDFAKEFLNGPA